MYAPNIFHTQGEGFLYINVAELLCPSMLLLFLFGVTQIMIRGTANFGNDKAETNRQFTRSERVKGEWSFIYTLQCHMHEL